MALKKRAIPRATMCLALQAETHRGLILRLNVQTTRVIETEIGGDDGGEFVGPHWLCDL